MKIFTLRIEVGGADTSADIAAKLERIAKSIRQQSDSATFLEDASYGMGALHDDGIHGTWSIEP